MLTKFLKFLSFGFLLGVLVHSLFFSIPISNNIIFIMIIIGVCFIFLFSKTKFLLVGIFIIGSAFGLLRFAVQIDEYQSHILDIFVAEKERVILYGEITSEPITNISYTQFIVSTDKMVTYAEKTLPIETRILVKTDNYTDYEYGQNILIQGNVTKPESFITDNQRIFDYKSYLAKDNVYYIMSYAEGIIFDEGKRSIQRSLYQLKQKFLYQMYRLIPEPESGLLAGILFGEKSALDDNLENKFRIVGLMHIVVLSGYNVSLVIQIFTKLLAFLPRALRSMLAVLGIAGFALLVGAGPTVIRASIMAVFIVLADVLGARYHITRALFIAGLIMVIWNPMILLFDISFQLSFLATYGLIVISPIIEKRIQFLPQIFAIRDSAVATISAQIMVLPLIVYSIGEFSLISPVVNVLVLFAVPIAMLTGFLTAIFGLLLSVFAPLFAIITTYFLHYQLWIVNIFSELSFSNLSIPKFHWVWMFILYILLFWWIKRMNERNVIL